MIISNSIIEVVSEALANYYTHQKLNLLFLENGALEEIPDGNKISKCREWLKKCGQKSNALNILGSVLETYMDVDALDEGEHKQQLLYRERICNILSKNNLSYHHGGYIISSNNGLPSQTLQKILSSKDLPNLDKEFERALTTVETDPATALTAACSIVEALCKVYIEDEGLSLPNDKTIKPLWKVVSQSLGFSPGSLEDDDLKKILSGFSSIIEGLGALRTHGGSAHGHGRKFYRIEPRHARLAINSAHTLCTFVIEAWKAKEIK